MKHLTDGNTQAAWGVRASESLKVRETTAEILSECQVTAGQSGPLHQSDATSFPEMDSPRLIHFDAIPL